MQSKKNIGLGLVLCSITFLLHALDTKKITIQINDQLLDGTVYTQPYSGFCVGQLRKNGIETLEVTVANNSAEPITISPSSITDIESISEKTAESGLLAIPRLVNVIMASVSLLLIAGWLAMRHYYPLAGKKRRLANILCGLAVVGLPLAGIFVKIEDYIWVQIAKKALFESVIVQPGQEVKKFIFVDKNRTLPQIYICRVLDAHGRENFIVADKVSVG